MPPDDAADLLQSTEPLVREQLFASLDTKTRCEVTALLAFAAAAAFRAVVVAAQRPSAALQAATDLR